LVDGLIDIHTRLLLLTSTVRRFGIVLRLPWLVGGRTGLAVLAHGLLGNFQAFGSCLEIGTNSLVADLQNVGNLTGGLPFGPELTRLSEAL
jgi:hypothetical protein